MQGFLRGPVAMPRYGVRKAVPATYSMSCKHCYEKAVSKSLNVLLGLLLVHIYYILCNFSWASRCKMIANARWQSLVPAGTTQWSTPQHSSYNPTQQSIVSAYAGCFWKFVLLLICHIDILSLVVIILSTVIFILSHLPFFAHLFCKICLWL